MFRRSIICCTSALTLPLCLLLSACGGEGGYGVASVPPPPPASGPTPSATPMPTPTPTPMPAALPQGGAYPLTRVGTYDIIGVFRLHPTEPGPITARSTSAGEFTITASQPAGQGFAYHIEAPADFLPGGLKAMDFGPASFAGMTDVTRGGYSQRLNFAPDKSIASSLTFDAGFSYVSMGEWDWWFVHLDGGTAGGFGQLFFVNGDRTPAAGTPASGTATYDAHTFASLSTNLTPGIPFTLTADFGERTISTRIDQDYRYQPNGDSLDYPAPGIHVAGAAPFNSSGSFAIPLSGTANYSGGYPLNTPETPPTQVVTGTMNGTFFGPRAEQVGGIFSLQNSAGASLLQDAFVGQQRKP